MDAIEPLQSVLDGDRAPGFVDSALATTWYVVDSDAVGAVDAVAAVVAGARSDTDPPPTRWVDELEGSHSLEVLSTARHATGPSPSSGILTACSQLDLSARHSRPAEA